MDMHPIDDSSHSDASYTPPPPDDSYWSALLGDEEIRQSEVPVPDDMNWQAYTENHPHDFIANNGFPIEDLPDWDEVERVEQVDEIVQLDVIGYNRGGLLVRWGELRGFVPASQLIDFPSNHEIEATRIQLLNNYVGKLLDLRIIELDRNKNRLILSERAAQTKQGQREHLLENLGKGDVVIGTVTNLCSFGAFIDLGGVEGLVHISELSWGRVRHPSDILHQNQKVEVYILDVVPDEGRVVLSIKRLQNDPWAGVADRYQVGQMVTGKITNVVDFGAFVCIEEGLEGLVHISELAEGQFLHPLNVVQEGIMVTAKILHIDGEERRLGLSLRQAHD